MPKGIPGSITHGYTAWARKQCRCEICRAACRENKKRYYHAHKLAWRNYELKKKYGITHADYIRMLHAQKGRCAICGATQKQGGNKRLHVDHDHDTKRVRGLLCSKCNGALGWFEKRLDSILEYLNGCEKHSEPLSTIQ